MPAKKISREQRSDAARLKALFKAWQAYRKRAGAPFVQEDVAAEMFGFGQSALSQYLNGTIPLNAAVVKKFSVVLGCAPATISPSIANQEREWAIAWLEADRPTVEVVPQPVAPHGFMKPSDYKKQMTKNGAPPVTHLGRAKAKRKSDAG